MYLFNSLSDKEFFDVIEDKTIFMKDIFRQCEILFKVWRKTDVDYFLNSFLHLHEQNHSSKNQANTKLEIVQKWLISVKNETHVL